MREILRKCSSIGRKIFFIVTIYFIVISLFSYFINKDKPKVLSNPTMQYRKELYSIANDPQYSKTKEGKAIVNTYRALSCGMFGEACTDNPNDANLYYKRSVFGRMASLITLPYRNPPASGIYWAYVGLQNAGFISKSYAAEGIGFAALSPIMNLWKVFRDLAYMILVLILIAIGFMIMFRAKLNPQTVISIENALPKIVISLILITFSFAIAGFLIDLMYILITLGIAVMSNRGNFFNITEMQNLYLNAGAQQLLGGMFPSKTNGFFISGWSSLMSMSQAFMNLLPSAIDQLLRFLLGAVSIVVLHIVVWNPLQATIGTFTDAVKTPLVGDVTGILGFLLRLAVMIASFMISFVIGYSILPLIILILTGLTLLALFFRLFFLILATYLRILLMVVFAPLFMLFEAIPGKSAFAYWFKQILADILVFPVVIILLMVVYVIVNMPASTGTLWQPPFLADINPNAFSILLGFGIMFQIPDFVQIIKELLGVKDMPIGLNLGTFFGGAAGVGGSAMGLASQVGSLSLAAGAFGGQLNLVNILKLKNPFEKKPG